MTLANILALGADSSPRLILATDEGKFYYIAAGAAGSTATWIANGAELLQEAILVEPTTAYELPDPADGDYIGQRLKYHIVPDGTNVDLTINAAITIPSDSLVSFPKTLTADLVYIVGLEWIGSKWMLTTIVGGGAA
jgi:hypothetical protein